MTTSEAMQELEAAGSAQTRKTYLRHGASPPLFGVSYAVQGKLRKKIKVNHQMAVELWSTGNHDARVLACMVADAAAFKQKEVEAWVKETGDQALRCELANLIVRAPFGKSLAEKYATAKQDWPRSLGWAVLSRLASLDLITPDSYFADLISRIESEIATAPNRTKHEMNGTLIAIGVRSPALEKQALAAAKRIGKVEVDHGDTSCQTPDAADYIRKSLAHRDKKKNMC